MTRSFPVKPAEELLDAEFTAKWRDRQTIGTTSRSVLETILGRFVELGGPVPLEALTPNLADRDPAEIADALRELDEKDMIMLRDGQVVLAYPFAGFTTPFRAVLPDGRERPAVCAVDALGIAPMLGQPVTIHSRCHHCGDPFRLEVGPTGPIGASEAMVWVGERSLLREKACDSL